MLKPEFTGQFKRDYKLAIKRGCKQEELQNVITLLVSPGKVDFKINPNREP